MSEYDDDSERFSEICDYCKKVFYYCNCSESEGNKEMTKLEVLYLLQELLNKCELTVNYREDYPSDCAIDYEKLVNKVGDAILKESIDND